MNIKNKERGFTIIEVVLVLAIAGLIFLMVFIALPALQRGQRDTQRKNDLSRFITAVTSYQTNNRGALPSGTTGTATTTWTSMLNRYVLVNGDTFVDPSGTDYILVENTTGTAMPATTLFVAGTPNLRIIPGATCDGEGITTAQGARKVAVQMKLEGSGITCTNN